MVQKNCQKNCNRAKCGRLYRLKGLVLSVSSPLQPCPQKKKKTNSKKASVEEKRPIIANFHAKLRLFLSTGQNPHPKWGRFLPKNRWNVDQVPLPFSCQPSETYEQKGADRVWVKQNQAGLEKRFCSLQLCFGPRPGNQQPKPTCIFRGQG